MKNKALLLLDFLTLGASIKIDKSFCARYLFFTVHKPTLGEQMTIQMANTLAILKNHLFTFSLDDISKAHLQAECMLNFVRRSLSDNFLTEDQEDALEELRQHLELNTVPEIDDAIGNGWADEGYEELCVELLEDLHSNVETLVSYIHP